MAAEPAPLVWLTGLPSAGKSTIARALAVRLEAAGQSVQVLDGDEIRAELTRDLGFTRADREENVRRIGFVADLLTRHGVITICPVISPYRSSRDGLRERVGARFVEVHVATPVEVCSERDVKGLYAKQRAGEIAHLTGVDDPYEPPLSPEVLIDAHRVGVDHAVEQIVSALTISAIEVGI
jgi:adenylylsulfate kinase